MARITSLRLARRSGKGTSAVPSVPVCTTLPALFSTLEVGVQRAITPGVWSGPAVTSRGVRLLDGGVDYRGQLNTALLYTPEAARLGHTIVAQEEVVDANGVSYYASSIGKVVGSAAGAFTATTVIPSKTLIQGTAATPWTPVVFSGGTQPYTVSVTPALPAGITLNASTGQFSGNASGTLAGTVFTVRGDDSAGNNASATFTLTINAAAAQALDPADYPANNIVSGFSGTYDGVTALNDGTLIHLGPATVGGVACDIRRIKQSFPLIAGGRRSENSWPDIEKYKLYPGRDFWMALAFQIKSDEALPADTLDDSMLCFQTHSPMSGSTQPDIGLFLTRQTNLLKFRSAYQTNPPDAQGNATTQATITQYTETIPSPGVWVRVIVHMRPGYRASHNPLLELWISVNGAAWSKKTLAQPTQFNTYNCELNGVPKDYWVSYPRIGLYKWSDSNWATPANPIAFYTSRLYFGEGADLLARAQAALAAFVP